MAHLNPPKEHIINESRETLSLVIPVFNEEDVVSHLIEEIEAYRADHRFVTRVVVVDDGSTDRTVAILKQLTGDLDGYRIISFSRNFGHQLAITAGLHAVDTDAAVILDGDLQDPLHVVSEMVERWKEGYDVVYGVRRRRKGESFLKKMTAVLFYRFFRLMTDLEMPVDTGDFRLVSAKVIRAYCRLKEQRPFVRALITWLGFSQIAVSYDRDERVGGRGKFNLKRMSRLAFDGLASFSDKPLRLAVRGGLFIAVVAGIGGIAWAIVAKYVLGTAISGWSSLMIVLVFFGGLNLFFVGLIGSYLARVFDQVKERPRYVVRNVWESANGSLEPDSDGIGERWPEARSLTELNDL